LPGPKKFKKAKFGHKPFQNRPNPQKGKRPNRGQISLKKIVDITRFKVRIQKNYELGSDFAKIGLKIYYFIQHSKKTKKWQNGKIILFLANSFKKGQKATLRRTATTASPLYSSCVCRSHFGLSFYKFVNEIFSTCFFEDDK